jgi:hypothetical protein
LWRQGRNLCARFDRLIFHSRNCSPSVGYNLIKWTSQIILK